jgi:Bacterial aa3 type cytochrome c oxidase subunit IV
MSVDSSKGHPAMDYAQHRATYAGFIRGSQIGVVFLVILMAGMAIFLT